MQLDRQLPHVAWLSPNRLTFNPYQGPASVKFQVSKDSSVSLSLYRVGSKAPTAKAPRMSRNTGKAPSPGLRRCNMENPPESVSFRAAVEIRLQLKEAQ